MAVDYKELHDIVMAAPTRMIGRELAVCESDEGGGGCRLLEDSKGVSWRWSSMVK